MESAEGFLFRKAEGIVQSRSEIDAKDLPDRKVAAGPTQQQFLSFVQIAEITVRVYLVKERFH